MHGAGGVIFWRVERGEVEPVGFNFRALSHFKAHRAKNRLDALQGQGDRVQAALPALAARQRHVQRLSLELHLQLSVGQCLAAVIERAFYGLLGQVDGRTACFFLFHAQGGHALHQLGHATRFTQKACLDVFQVGRRCCLCKRSFRIVNDGV